MVTGEAGAIDPMGVPATAVGVQLPPVGVFDTKLNHLADDARQPADVFIVRENCSEVHDESA
jgi:hypothetical protein